MDPYPIHRIVKGICLALSLLFVGHAALAGGEDKKAQGEDVVYAVNVSSFGQRGGDPVTFSGGQPLVTQTVFENLVTNDHEMRDIPALAKAWKIDPNWRYIDIMLRDDLHNIKFHNGAPVTAEDVKFSLETYRRPDLKWVFAPLYKSRVKHIEVLNPHQIRVHLRAPFLRFLSRLAFAGGIFPREYRQKVGDVGFAERPVGAGPFRWVDYKQDRWFKVEAVKTHYRKAPEFRSIKFIYVPEGATRLAMLKAGEVDIAPLTGPQVPVIQADPNLRLVVSKYHSGTVLAYADLAAPKEASPFHDIRVREAASLAIDRKTICKKILFGLAEPYGEVLSPVSFGFDPSIQPDPYDPVRARDLLAEAGYPEGFRTQISTMPASRYWVQAIASNLADVGIRAELKLYEGGTWLQAFQAKKLRGLIPAYSFIYAIKEAPSNLANFYLRGMPWCYVTTREISRAVVQGNSAISDKDLAKAGRKISRLVLESRINMHLWANHVAYAIGPRIKHFRPNIGANPVGIFEYITLRHQ